MLKPIRQLHQPPRPHWVGNGFHVSTYFPGPQLPAQRVSPFVLMDYGPPKDFAPLTRGSSSFSVNWPSSRPGGENTVSEKK